MLREDVERRLRERRLVDGYLLPDYGGYCFGRVAGTIESLLGVDADRAALGADPNPDPDTDREHDADPGARASPPATGESQALPADVLPNDAWGIDAVVCVLVDGLGLEQWRRHRGCHPLLDRVTERARVTPLTSVYPSETAAAMTTLATGRTPVEHGLLGWNVYDRHLDVVYESLPFRTKSGTTADEAGVDPADLFAGTGSTDRLARAGVDPHVVVPEPLTASPHARRAYAGATVHAYDDDAELATLLGSLVDGGAPATDGDRALDGARNEDGNGDGDSQASGDRTTGEPDRTFVHAYLPQVDAAAHRHGTTDEAYVATLRSVFDAVAAGLGVRATTDGTDSTPGNRGTSSAGGLDPERTLVCLTADHGHVDTDPDGGLDLLSIPAVDESIRRTAGGRPAIAGGPRNVHLFLEDGSVGRVRAALSTHPATLRTYTRAEALAAGLFGPGPAAPQLDARIGDLIVIPRDESAWYAAAGESEELELVGMHGGLHPDEMIVPFAVARLSTLRDR
jgi:hypothetical protein